MAKGISSSAVDFDDLFDPDVVGDGPSAAWLTSGGAALRYAALSYGTKRADVGYRNSAGVDVSNLWASKGTAVYSITGLHGKTLTVSDGALTNQSQVSATASVSILSNGTWSVSGGGQQGAQTQPAPTSGTWLPAGASISDHEVEFVVASSGSADRVVSNGAPAYATASATRSVSMTLPTISGNNATQRQATATFTVRLRRISTGAVSTSTVSVNLSTSGYL